jgi:hypothetical protein
MWNVVKDAVDLRSIDIYGGLFSRKSIVMLDLAGSLFQLTE